ncbi:hypothetical protein HAX54_051587, partial [Datura stramonium]|nr:hypothetical protein [Datura stramonium]
FKAKENWNDSVESCNHDSQNGSLKEGTACDLTSIERSYGCIERAVEITNGSCNLPVVSSREGDTNSEESIDKDSGVEESNEQGEDFGITPEARMAYIIDEDKERAEWITSGKLIYKVSLNFLAKSWWSTVRHHLAPTVNDNALSADRAALVACIMSEYLLNIPQIISVEIRERVVKENTTLPFPSLIYHLCMESGVP